MKILNVSSVVEEGNPVEATVASGHGLRWACGLGRVERLLLGSVSEALVTRAACTVEVVRER